jgi:hypothetical protein
MKKDSYGVIFFSRLPKFYKRKQGIIKCINIATTINVFPKLNNW